MLHLCRIVFKMAPNMSFFQKTLIAETISEKEKQKLEKARVIETFFANKMKRISYDVKLNSKQPECFNELLYLVTHVKSYQQATGYLKRKRQTKSSL